MLPQGTKVRLEQLPDHGTKSDLVHEGVLTRDLIKGGPLVVACTQGIEYILKTTPVKLLYGMTMGDACNWRMVVTANHTYRITVL